MDQRKFSSFSEFQKSGSLKEADNGNSNKEMRKKKLEEHLLNKKTGKSKYSSISYRAVDPHFQPRRPSFVEEVTKDYSLIDNPSNEKGFIHEGTYNADKKSEGKYTKSAEYRAYLKEQDKKKGEEELVNASEHLDKIFSAVKQDLEKKKPGAEDLKLQKDIYESSEKCEAYLKDVLAKKRSEENETNLKDFKQSPYVWMRMDLNKRIGDGVIALRNTENPDEQKRILEVIVKNKQTLDNLKRAMAKNLPLKLDRKFNNKEIILDSGKSFNTADNIEDINKKVGAINSAYDIVGVVQRANADLVIFKNNKGEELEVETDVLEKIVREKNPKYIEKSKEFEKIKAGETLAIRVGGEGNAPSVYKILEIKGGKVFFENITTGTSKGQKTKLSMPIENMRALLFDEKNEFFVREDFKVRGSPGVKVPEKKREPVVSIVEPVTVEPVVENISKPVVETMVEEKKIEEKKIEPTVEQKEELKKLIEERKLIKKNLESMETGSKEKVEDLPIGGFMAETLASDEKENISQPIELNPEVTELVGNNLRNENQEGKENLIKILDREQLEQEVRNNISNLLERDELKKKKPEIKEFRLESIGDFMFKIDSTIKINKTGVFLYPTATINLKIYLTNNEAGELDLTGHSIEAGMATKTAKKEIEPALPELVLGIKTYFEKKYNKSIESMKIADGKLVLRFKE